MVPMIPLLVLRPEPGASATAARAREMGLDPIIAPLFEVAPRAWDAPDPAAFDALILTSAHTLRYGGPRLAPYHHLPTFAVGEATAAAARAAGFHRVEAGARDAAALIALVAARGHAHALHLCGEDYRDAPAPGLKLTRVPVYRAGAVDTLPPALADALAQGPAVAALHSPRAGELFARLLDEPARASIALAAISQAAAEAAGPGWRTVAIAPVPTDAAVLAEAARLCERRR